MKTNVLITFLFIVSVNLSAQLDSFKLADYRLADLKRQSIDIDFNADFNSYEENYFEPATGDYSSTSLGGTLNGAYRFYRNTRSYQGNHSLTLSNQIRFDLDKQEQTLLTDENKQIQKYFSNGIGLYTSNRFYFNNLFFVEVSGRIGYSHILDKDKDEDYQDNQLAYRMTEKDKYTSAYISLPLSFGKGRIESVEDARHALYILKELEKNARLTRTPSKDEILQIAANISKFKNERVLDSRLKKIYELKQLDSLLQSMDLIETGDISYFAIVNDMWDFGGLQQRNAGYRVAVEYSPTYDFRKTSNETINENILLNTKSEDKLDNNINYFTNYVGLSYLIEKPFKQKFQHTVYTGIHYRKANVLESEGFLYVNEDKTVSARASYYLGIYPTTRTDFSIGGSLSYGKIWEQDGNDKATRYGGYVNSVLNYYFSPRLRLNFNYRFWYDKNEYSEGYGNSSQYFNHDASIALIYNTF